MRHLNAMEFVEQLRKDGCEWADELADAIDFQENSNHLELVEGIAEYAPYEMSEEDPLKGVEWLGDRSQLLDEIKDSLDKVGIQGDVDNSVNELIEIKLRFDSLLGVLKERGWLEDGEDETGAIDKLPHNL